MAYRSETSDSSLGKWSEKAQRRGTRRKLREEAATRAQKGKDSKGWPCYEDARPLKARLGASVNGDWFNENNEEELGSFSCQACVQVAARGFKEIEARNEQELWLSVATEVVDNTQSKVHCLRFGSGLDDLQMKLQDSCGSTMTAEFQGVTESSSRLVKFTEGSNQRIHTKDHEEAGHRLRPSLIDCWGRGAVGKVEMMHLFNTNRAQTAAYVGRVLVPGSVAAHGTSSWQRLSTLTGYGWTKADYPAATETRLCLTYSDHATTSDHQLHVRLRRTDGAGGTVYFTDIFPQTWSGTGLYHHVCGPWHDLSPIDCGYGWGTTCQVDWWHSTYMSIQSVELEMGSNNPDNARFYRGRMDIPAAYDATPTANTWTTISAWLYLEFNNYDANFYRHCLTFTDSSSGGVLYVRLYRADGVTFFQDNLGGTWSGSGLAHSECGAWHSLDTVYCGASWGNACVLQIYHTQSVNVRVFEADLELKSATGLYINTNDYPTATDLRACIVFTDSSSGGGTFKVRLRRTDTAGGTVFFEDQG
eukprot:Skav219263  [mRNA]  locus=scaffold1380:56615:64336:- [translate_table: standard]